MSRGVTYQRCDWGTTCRRRFRSSGMVSDVDTMPKGWSHVSSVTRTDDSRPKFATFEGYLCPEHSVSFRSVWGHG